MKKLSLTPFTRAVTRLERAIAVPTDLLNDFQIEMIRDAIIQRFEYTYELAWKFIRRAIREMEGETVLDQMLTRHDLFRKAAELKLIEDVTAWMDYHEARNITSHIYDVEVAIRVHGSALRFVHDARKLLMVLQSRYDA